MLLLKLLLAPALVVGSSLAGRRWGARVTGVLVALPIVAGPILLISCLEHGTRFGAAAAASSLLGLVTLALFAVVFAWFSRRAGAILSLAVTWAACLAADVALAQVQVSPWVGFPVVLLAAWGASRVLARGTVSPGAPLLTTRPWWDLPGRAAATASLVVLVTSLAGALGPAMTGVLAPFPIATSVVAAFTLAQAGHAQTVQVLRGILTGLLGFTVFCLLVALLVDRVGVAAGFGVAGAGTLLTQVAWQLATGRGPARGLRPS